MSARLFSSLTTGHWPLTTFFAALLLVCLGTARIAHADTSAIENWNEALSDQLLDYYQDPKAHANETPVSNAAIGAHWTTTGQRLLAGEPSTEKLPYPLAAGAMKGRLQQALTYEMSLAVRSGRIEDAKALRAELDLPRGVSSAEGALLMEAITPANREQTANLLVREAITWQTTRVRSLFDEATQAVGHGDIQLPGRLLEEMGEALALADLPNELKVEAGITGMAEFPAAHVGGLLSTIERTPWSQEARPLLELRELVESHLPSLLSDKERNRRERLLLKLVELIPKEYEAGVRDGKVTVPLEYREAVNFTQDARQIVDELAPLWLGKNAPGISARIDRLEKTLAAAAKQIEGKAKLSDLEATLATADKILTDEFGISLRRSGTTGDIVDEVMLETRSLLSKSLSAALEGQWDEAKRLRVEAYTTYDPELEARLMPRDPQLAMDIERLLLDGLDHPGVKVLLDTHASPDELQAGYARVNEGLTKATALLKTDITPTAAATSAASIVLREGLEGLLVIIAILAGLRGEENKARRRLFWGGVALSVVATGITWILSQTIITSLRSYGEIISAVTGILAIAVLLLITNWLFHQVYWRQWVTTLKNHAQGEKAWQLLSVGFLVGYREGFETVLFLQNLYIDAGGRSVLIGVLIGAVLLLALGLAALKLGMKLPYFQILMATALLIGFVLITFVGGTIRAAQTVGWIPVHRLIPGSWPTWMGTWFGLNNTVESISLQVLTCIVVLGTWRYARWQAKRKVARRLSLSQSARPAPDCAPFVCADRPGCPFGAAEVAVAQTAGRA